MTPSESHLERQLRLFDIDNPLRDRFSDSFFKRIPRSPGIYWMQDRHGHVLYVGKAKCLRTRLRSYRAKGFALFPNKTQRLLVNVHEIHWQETTDELSALLLESEWLRALKPRFNIIGVASESYSYFSFQENTPPSAPKSIQGFTLELSIGRRTLPQPTTANETRVFGAYRGITASRRAHAALARWLWAVQNANCTWPTPFFRPVFQLRPESRVFIPQSSTLNAHHDEIAHILARYLLGHSPLPELLLPEEEPSLFLQTIWRNDQIVLDRFFRSCEALRALREKFQLESRPLTVDEVDDLRIIASEALRRRREPRHESPELRKPDRAQPTQDR